MSHQRDTLAARCRSKVSNGTHLLPGIDARSTWMRRFKDVIAAHISDLGGIENCSEAERSIIRRASTLTVELERLELRFAQAGEANDAELAMYQSTANGMRRLLEAVGLRRRARTDPNIVEILQRHEDAA